MYSGGSEFVTKFLSVLKLLIFKICFWHQSDFLFHIYKSLANTNSKQQELLWIETTQIQIKESPQYKYYNNTGDLSIRSFGYHNSDTKRSPWVTFRSHCPINDYLHPAIYTTPLTLQLCYKHLGILQRVTKSQKVHISDHDGLENLHNINFFWYRSEGFPEREQSGRNFPLPQSSFLRTIDLLFFKQYVYYSLTSIY